MLYLSAIVILVYIPAIKKEKMLLTKFIFKLIHRFYWISALLKYLILKRLDITNCLFCLESHETLFLFWNCSYTT